MRKVVVTGLGVVSPLGIGTSRAWSNLLAGVCGITAIQDARFARNESRIAGLVPRGSKDDGKWTSSEHVTRDDERRMPLFMQYGMAAAREALEDARWFPTTVSEREMTGVCIGSGIGAFEDVYNTSLAFEKAGPKKVSPFFVPRLLVNLAAGHVSMNYGFKGPNHAATTACTTGAHSIGDAARFIALGDADVMVAGGAESCIHPLALTGFERSRSLSTSFNDRPELASRPFSKARDGFVMAEGAGVMVLEELNHAKERGASIYAQVSGYGATADAYHLTQPPSDGNGAFRAMRRALETAGLNAEEVDYVNAHATSTPLGDVAEANAIAALTKGACVSSTKGATGHLLGAAGALEAIFTILAVKHDMAPATLNLEDVDEALPKIDHVIKKTRHREIRAALSNSFGFGGTNASLCFTKMM